MNLQRARDLAQQLVDELADAPLPPEPALISTDDQLDRAISTAAAGDTLYLAPEFRSARPWQFTKAINLIGHRRSSADDGTGRMPATGDAPKFTAGIILPADSAGVGLAGLEVTNGDAPEAVIDDRGEGNNVTRCRLLGDPVKGQRRGIAANGRHSAYALNYIGGMFAPQPGVWTDSQAICCWDSPGPIAIVDNYLEGSSEGILIGGADSASADTMPANISILSNTLFKPLAWQVPGINVKNGIELKVGRNVTIEDNDIINVFGGQGQDGFAIVLTVRNQGGRAPWSTIADVTVRGNRIRSAPGAIFILGVDDIKETKAGKPTPVGQVLPSVRMSNVTIQVNTFDDMDPDKWYPGVNLARRLMMLNHGAKDLSIVENQFRAPAGRFSSVVYFVAGPAFEHLLITGNEWPRSKYGVFGNAAPVNGAFPLYASADSQLAGNTEV